MNVYPRRTSRKPTQNETLRSMPPETNATPFGSHASAQIGYSCFESVAIACSDWVEDYLVNSSESVNRIESSGDHARHETGS